MTRVKKGVHALKRRRKVLKQAKEALLHAGAYAFAHRRDKKSHNRKLWNIKINAGSRELGLSYSKLIDALKKKKIMLNRKILADLAENHPSTFAKVLESVKS